tara:strand:- start:275 stop:517 length:243 start_codon:yes stop_codon:yes gene_type:complete
MQISYAKLLKMFGLNAYQDKYGEFIHDVATGLLERQAQKVSEFIMQNAPNISDSNYIVVVEINQELWIRDLWEKCEKGDY